MSLAYNNYLLSLISRPIQVNAESWEWFGDEPIIILLQHTPNWYILLQPESNQQQWRMGFWEWEAKKKKKKCTNLLSNMI